MGRYQEGTATGDFLRKTVADYDVYMAQQEAANAGIDPETLSKILTNPEIAALLKALEKSIS